MRGVKASLIEWERAGGVDRPGSRVRTTQQLQDYLDVLAGVAQWLPGLGVASDCDGEGGPRPGSYWLGLSECEGMGWRLQDLDGCSFSSTVCAGFSARASRVRQGDDKIGVAPGTP